MPLEPPKELYKIQKWFGKIVRQPLLNDQIQSHTPDGNPIEEEAPYFIAPSLTLNPHERMEIYNQQYWWRLTATLQDHFPTVLRLFGPYAFNQQLAVPYLEEHSPLSWNLNLLGDTFCEWLEKNYGEPDKPVVLCAAKTDLAFIESFIAAQACSPRYPFSFDEKLYLTPAANLFHFPYHIFEFRKELNKKEADYWLENPFPTLKKGDFYFLFYRNPNHDLVWLEIPKEEYEILEKFSSGLTFNELCSMLDDHPDKSRVEKSLKMWIQSWISRPLLTLDSPPMKTTSNS